MRSASMPDAMIAHDAEHRADDLDDQEPHRAFAVNRNTQDSGNTVTMWNSAKLASGANAPMHDVAALARDGFATRPGCSSRLSNSDEYSGVTTMRSRANSATTLIAKATKNG